MRELITITVAIALISLLFYSGSSIINEDKYIEKGVETEIKSRFSLISQGYNAYRLRERMPLPVVSWQSEFSKHSTLPNDYKGLSWTYNSNGNGNYFCLTGTVNSDMLLNAFVEISNDFPNNSFYYNTSCGATSNFAVLPSTSGGVTVSATFYLR